MKRLSFLFVLAVFAGSPALADFTRGARTVAVFGGLGGSSARYDFDGPEEEPVTGGGGAFGAQALYYLTDSPSIAVGLDLSAGLNGDMRSDELLNGYDMTGRLKSRAALVIARLAYPKGVWRPYVFGGLGAHDSSLRLTGRNRSTGNELTFIDEDRTSFAAGYGVGMDIFPTETFFIGAELRGLWLAGLDPDETSAARAAGFELDDEDDAVTQGAVLLRAGLRF